MIISPAVQSVYVIYWRGQHVNSNSDHVLNYNDSDPQLCLGEAREINNMKDTTKQNLKQAATYATQFFKVACKLLSGAASFAADGFAAAEKKLKEEQTQDDEESV